MFDSYPHTAQEVKMDGWIYGGRPSSKEILFSLYSDDHVGKNSGNNNLIVQDNHQRVSESGVDFSVSVDDIIGIDEKKIAGKLVLGGDSKWEIALLDFCMPNNIISFPNVSPSNYSSAAYVYE